ncbi:unnamed protein product [Fraxinus pennsylvanica]|uniref:Protein kinase domain-containing protein n=1 Tax=Fraxinus pennsylvanica TaxID=56036 RepID=A0AAD2E2Q5_9LAMI|nr:unnamed protein product [Fraxinus pennsylvanica]
MGLGGTIAKEIGDLSSLRSLVISNNNFHCIVPDEMGNLSQLREIEMQYNELTGSIPSSFGFLKNLHKLNVYNNRLSGNIPNRIFNISSLIEIDFANNSLSESLPMDICYSLPKLEMLTISMNQISGNIPPSNIPNEIGNLSTLAVLHLGFNGLNGTYIYHLVSAIPKSMEKLKDLVHFNVSFNELSGEIPNGGPFNNLTADSFTGNSEVCGASQYKVPCCKSNTTPSSRTITALKFILPLIALVAYPSIIIICLMRRHTRNSFLPTRCSSSIAFNVKRIPYYEVLNATNKFGEENLIGSGSIGSVYKGIFSNGMIAAIKVFNLDLEGAKKSFDNECQILCNIHHRNLLLVISSCSNLDLKALVLEYMPNGNLNKWLSSSTYCLDIAQRLEITIDVACALEYLHHAYPSPIVHCDLKPSNILLDEDMVAHVGDFGISKLLKPSSSRKTRGFH